MFYRPKKNRIPAGYIPKISQFNPDVVDQGFTTPDIVVSPSEPIVQEVINEMRSENSSFFDTVSEVRVDSTGGGYGFVKSDEPNVININWPAIQNEFATQSQGRFDPNNESHKSAIKSMIREVIVHEKAHVDDAVGAQSSADDLLAGSELFPGGESVAEQSTREYLGQ